MRPLPKTYGDELQQEAAPPQRTGRHSRPPVRTDSKKTAVPGRMRPLLIHHLRPITDETGEFHETKMAVERREMKEAEGLNFDQALAGIRAKGTFQTERHGPDGNVQTFTHTPRRAAEIARWNPEKAKKLETEGTDCLIALDERRIYTTEALRTETDELGMWCGCSDDNKDCKRFTLSMGLAPEEGLIAEEHPDRENHRQATICPEKVTEISNNYQNALTNHNWQAVEKDDAAESTRNSYRCRDCLATLEVREHLIENRSIYPAEAVVTAGTVTKAGADIQARWLKDDSPDSKMTPCTTSQWKAVLRAENRYR